MKEADMFAPPKLINQHKWLEMKRKIQKTVCEGSWVHYEDCSNKLLTEI